MVRNVVIVGGGSAGWMTASYLSASFGEQVAVTVVESPIVSTIGVGEATFSTIRHFFAHLGVAETEWMPFCNATYKLGIRFRNWRAEGHDFYHPFERSGVVDGFTLADWWLSNGHAGQSQFDRDLFLISALCDAKRSPRYLDGAIFEEQTDFDDSRLNPGTLTGDDTQFPYAYHLDAALLAAFLTTYATSRGVRRIEDHVVHVGRDERGWISHIRGEEHGVITADLYVDCTGFSGLLINRTLEEPFVSFQDFLPNDRAVAFRVPVEQGDDIQPYTTATAVEAGWIWTIPLYGRIGTGYVYASDYSTADAAEQALRDFVGPSAADVPANHIRMRIGRNRSSWVHNCVAIGLSSGFVEPLESTGIFLIHHGIEQLVRHWPGADWDEGLRIDYNRQVARCFDGIRDFLVFHYYGAARSDNAYWRDTKLRPLPDGLADRVEQWRTRLPETENVYPYYHGFEPYSHTCMLLGLGRITPKPCPALPMLAGAGRARQAIDSIRETAEKLVQALPSHFDYLAQLHGRPTDQ